MPFSWFGDSHKEHSSGSTLSFSQGGPDTATEQSQEKNRNKVNVYKLAMFCALDLIASAWIYCICSMSSTEGKLLQRTFKAVRICID